MEIPNGAIASLKAGDQGLRLEVVLHNVRQATRCTMGRHEYSILLQQSTEYLFHSLFSISLLARTLTPDLEPRHIMIDVVA